MVTAKTARKTMAMVVRGTVMAMAKNVKTATRATDMTATARRMGTAATVMDIKMVMDIKPTEMDIKMVMDIKMAAVMVIAMVTAIRRRTTVMVDMAVDMATGTSDPLIHIAGYRCVVCYDPPETIR